MKLGTVPEFALIADDSSSVTRKYLIGKITIADFIFTTCGGPCPLMSSKMQELQTLLGKLQQVQFLSFSVDPDYDTPQILREYAGKYGAIRNKWRFVTGERKQIYNLAQNGFHLVTNEDEGGILHSTKFVLIDRDGIIRGYYDSEETESLQRLSQDARSLAELNP